MTTTRVAAGVAVGMIETIVDPATPVIATAARRTERKIQVRLPVKYPRVPSRSASSATTPADSFPVS
jgi:hypothetical protein